MQTCNIMGVNIAVTDMNKTLRLVEDNCEAWRGKYICVANVHTTVTAHDDPTYLRVQNARSWPCRTAGRCPDTAARRALPTPPA